MNRKLLGLAVAAVVALPLSGCAAGESVQDQASAQPKVADSDSSRYIAVDGPRFESVAALEASSVATVRGRYGRLVTKVAEGALLRGEASQEGLPLSIWTFTIDQVLAGEGLAVGDEIRVTEVDQIADGSFHSAEEGREAVLFLHATYDAGTTWSVAGLGQGSLVVTIDGGLRAPEGSEKALQSDLDKTDIKSLAR